MSRSLLANRLFVIWIWPNCDFRCGAQRLETSDLIVVPGRWMHVAATVGVDGVRLFVDGAVAGSGEGSDLTPNDGDLLIGCRLDPSSVSNGDRCAPYEGLIGELLIFRRQFSSDELYELRSIGKQDP